MVDVVSIVIAVISFVGALSTALLTGWIGFWSDERKRLSESEKLVRKYRDPLLLAAQDLQSRLWSMADGNILASVNLQDTSQHETLVVYTAFLVGQYFSWTYILRRQAQFLCFSTDKENRDLSEILFAIQREFSKSDYEADGQPFRLWHGQQMAIGEIMTVREKDEGEFFCIGYAAFKTKWSAEPSFEKWFEQIKPAIEKIGPARDPQVPRPDKRLRRLQHLLLELTHILDPKKVISGAARFKLCEGATGCNCRTCRSRKIQKTSSKLPWWVKRASQERETV